MTHKPQYIYNWRFQSFKQPVGFYTLCYVIKILTLILRIYSTSNSHVIILFGFLCRCVVNRYIYTLVYFIHIIFLDTCFAYDISCSESQHMKGFCTKLFFRTK